MTSATLQDGLDAVAGLRRLYGIHDDAVTLQAGPGERYCRVIEGALRDLEAAADERYERLVSVGELEPRVLVESPIKAETRGV